MRKRQGLQENPFDYAEDHGVGGYAKRQSEDSDGAEARGFAQDAHRVAEVMNQHLNELQAAGLAALLLDLRQATEFQTRAPLGLFARQPRSHVFVDLLLKMKPEFVG